MIKGCQNNDDDNNNDDDDDDDDGGGGGENLFSLTPPGVNESRDPTFILCSLSNLDSALEKGGGDFGGELFSSRLLSRLVYLIDIIMIN